MSGSTKSVQTDLVIVIDTSGSMKDEAKHLSDEMDLAIHKAEQNCSADLRLNWFGIEGTWEGTEFTQSYRDYLFSHSPELQDSDLAGERYDGGRSVDAKEQGACAVEDIAHHFDWRDGSQRTIFYLGDEGLKGGDPRDEEDVKARDRAVVLAKQEKVKVFTYLGTPLKEGGLVSKENVEDYQKLAEDTGGAAYTSEHRDIDGFAHILASVICRKPGDKKKKFDRQNIGPGELWRPTELIQLGLIVIFEEERRVEGSAPGLINCKNTGVVALRNITLAMSLDDRLDSFEAVFTDTSTDSRTVSIPDLAPGEETHVQFSIELVRDDPSFQPALDQAYRIRIRPSFQVDFRFDQSAHYNTNTLAQGDENRKD